MNKMIYLCAAAALSLASCSNDETVEMAKGNAINFRTVAGLNTRGVETTQTNLTSMYVTAYDQDGTSPYFSNVEFARDGQTNTFVSNPSRFWTKNTMHFLALAPQATDWPATNNISFANNAFEATFTDVTPDADVANQKDLMIGKASGSQNTDASGLDLTLNHVLSQIQIQAKNGNTAYVYEIKGVRIASVVAKGSYTFSTNAWNVEADHQNATLQTYNVVLDNPITLDGKDATAKNLMKQVNKASDNAMLIPQQLTAWAGDKANSGDNFDKGSYISLLLNVKSSDQNAKSYIYPAGSTVDAKTYGWAAVAVGTKWEAGKKYIYTLDLSNGAGKVDPVEPNPDPTNPSVKPQPDGKDPDKGEDIMGDPIKFDVTVTEWDDAFAGTTDGDLKM